MCRPILTNNPTCQVSIFSKKVDFDERELSTSKEIHKKCPNDIQTHGEGTPKPCLWSSKSETYHCNIFLILLLFI